ncbi:helix-turn-helix domain-containing protein [Lysobacter terrae]
MSDKLSNYSATALAAGEAALGQLARNRNGLAPGYRWRKMIANASLPFAGGELSVASEDIAEPTQWEIEQDRHTLIVHLEGEMRRLETRIGRGETCRAPAKTGEIWLIPAGAHYVGRALGGSIAYAEYHISQAWLRALVGDKPQTSALRPLMKLRDPLLHGLTGRLIQLGNDNDDMSGMLRESIAQVLGLHLLREYAIRAPADLSSDAGPKLSGRSRKRLEDYIVSHLDQHLSIDELAALAGMTPHHLIAAFRRSFGMTPLQYVISQRLQVACTLLESTRQDIMTIALATGFSSHSHLTSAFKQRFGITPRQFRRQAKGVDEG